MQLFLDPVDFKYTKEHDWIELKEGIGTVGITNHAQDSLGDIVYFEFMKGIGFFFCC